MRLIQRNAPCIWRRVQQGSLCKEVDFPLAECKDLDGTRGHGFIHRDKNAAVNIMSIYEALADEDKKERPIQFRPVRGSRYS